MHFAIESIHFGDIFWRFWIQKDGMEIGALHTLSFEPFWSSKSLRLKEAAVPIEDIPWDASLLSSNTGKWRLIASRSLSLKLLCHAGGYCSWEAKIYLEGLFDIWH